MAIETVQSLRGTCDICKKEFTSKPLYNDGITPRGPEFPLKTYIFGEYPMRRIEAVLCSVNCFRRWVETSVISLIQEDFDFGIKEAEK